MSEPIGPGDWVECVRAGDRRGVLVVGGVYRVSEVIPDDIGCSESCQSFGIILADGPRSMLRAWCGCRFRPIYRPKRELIRDLMRPIEEKSDA